MWRRISGNSLAFLLSVSRLRPSTTLRPLYNATDTMTASLSSVMPPLFNVETYILQPEGWFSIRCLNLEWFFFFYVMPFYCYLTVRCDTTWLAAVDFCSRFYWIQMFVSKHTPRYQLLKLMTLECKTKKSWMAPWSTLYQMWHSLSPLIQNQNVFCIDEKCLIYRLAYNNG